VRNAGVLWRREMAALFLSPAAYVIAAIFLLAAGGSLLLGVSQNSGRAIPPQALLFEPLCAWLTVLTATVTMRLFADEKKSGTIETLMTAPVTDTEVVVGKYAGALTFVLLCCAPVVACLYLLDFMSPGIRGLDTGAVAGGCVFVFLFSAMSVAVGEVISLTTRNQIVAAITTLFTLWILLLGGWLLAALPLGLAGIGSDLSLAAHIEAFERGVVDTRAVVLCASITAFSLFACVRLLETRRWN